MGTTIRGLHGVGSISATTALSVNQSAAKAQGFEDALNTAAAAKDDKKLKEAAKEFESYFIQTMLKEMRKTVPTDGLIPKSNAEEMFQSMLDEEYAASAAEGQGIGLADMIYKQMSRENASADVPVDPMGREAGLAAEAYRNGIKNAPASPNTAEAQEIPEVDPID